MSVILGYGGTIQLNREWPEPTVFPQSSRAGVNSIFCQNKAFWTGQKVLIYSSRGIPFIKNGSAYAPCPDGHRFWGGSDLAQGPNTSHRASGNTFFWNSANYESFFWENEFSTGFNRVITAYINRDQLDRITFYLSENAAINRFENELLIFSNVEYKSLLIAPYSSSTNYQVAFEALGEFMFDEDCQYEKPVSSIIELPNEMLSVAEDPEQRGWSILVGCREWTLQTDPTVLDTTAIGEDFGDSVKDVIKGSGSFNGFINANNRNAGQFDARGFIRLMLMTETGSRARARFRVQDQRSAGCQSEDAVWIEADILLGPGEISASVDDAVKYSSQFVVVRDKDGIGIKPMIGPFA